MVLVLEKFQPTMFPAMIRVCLNFPATGIFDLLFSKTSKSSKILDSSSEVRFTHLLLGCKTAAFNAEFKPATLFTDTIRFNNR